MKIVTSILLTLLVLGAIGSYLYLNSLQNKNQSVPVVQKPAQAGKDTHIIVSKLEIPWEIEFLPDGTFFVTERKGIVWQFEGSNKKKMIELKDVAHIGEGGLLGIVNHPKHEVNGLTYLYYTYDKGTKNKVVRYKHIHDSLTQDKVIIDDIPGNSFHNGGRIKFGPDDKLYITAGDSQNPSTAQNLDSLAGKILRLNDDGSIPTDNPFPNSPIYSYGHRNPQGLAWDTSGRFWETEHGQNAHDEVNIINKGENYGWPVIQGEQTKDHMNKPYTESGNSTWAPSGAAVVGNKLYFAGLRGQAIYILDIKPRITLEIQNPIPIEHFKNEFGRIRSINLGPDSYFYILTNNTDGRGNPAKDDDKIIKVSPKTFE